MDISSGCGVWPGGGVGETTSQLPPEVVVVSMVYVIGEFELVTFSWILPGLLPGL
jgi:hypothetical protein